MNMKKLLCTILAMLMALSAVALAEGEDLQAQLDAANARIAELEAEVELYRPFYDRQVVAEYGDGGIIWLDDAQAEYQNAASAYSQYGLSIDDYADQIKPDILRRLVRDAVLDGKIAELGLDQLDEETRASLETEAAETFENYIESYKSYFASEDATDEEAREQTIAAMEQYGLTQDTLLEQMILNYADEQLHTYVTKDVTVSEEEIQAKYEALVAADEQSYADNDRSYNTARNGGTTIAWNPEGYRAVKHVLIKFNDDQNAKYKDLNSTLDSLKQELEALDSAETAEEAPEEAAETAETTDEAAETADETAEAAEAQPRTREEIQGDIARISAELDELYNELLPRAQEVVDKFEAGEDFDSLIEQYNEDPGMQNEPAATNGYAVAASSTTWDMAFTEGAMSIESVGGISAPIYGMNGIHIIYYLSDITPGAVPFEDIAEYVETTALEDKTSEIFNSQVDAWVEEAHPVYHDDRF